MDASKKGNESLVRRKVKEQKPSSDIAAFALRWQITQRPAYGAESPLCQHKPEVIGSAILRHVARHALHFGLHNTLLITDLGR